MKRCCLYRNDHWLTLGFFIANQDKGARLGELKARLKFLPDCNIDTLQFLIQHLRR